tara:strand:+ start:1083 stop:3485 length:2403 start_codon:yes stop_codon:yes gene_type:complete
VNQSSTVDLIVRFSQPLKAFRAVDQAAKKTNQTLEKTQDVLRKVTEASRGVKASIEATQQSLPKLSQVQGVLAAKVRNSEQAMRSQIKALRDLQVRVKFNGSLYNKLGDEIAKYETKLRSANRTTENAKTTNNGLAAGLRRLAIGFGAARAAQATLQAGIRRDESERRLRLLTEGFGETAQAQEAAQRAADKFNLSQTEANVQLSRLIARLRPMGLSMQTIETAFAGFNTATILAGATASESAGAFLQLSQALGSGVLRGQELNSILEQAPLIAQAISTEMGVTVGALKKLGEEGEITSEIVIAALGRVEREGAGQLTEALKGPAASIKDFQNAAEDVQVALTQDIIPEMAASFKELADLIKSLGPLFRGVGGQIGGGLGAINDVISTITKPADVGAREILERGRMPIRGLSKLFEPLGGKQFTERLRDQAATAAKVTGKDVTELFVANLQRALKTLDAKASTLPSNFEMMVLNAGGPTKRKPTELSDEEKKRLEKIELQNVAASERLRISGAELKIMEEQSATDKIRLQFALKKANTEAKYADLLSKSLSDAERDNLRAAERNELDIIRLEKNEAITKALQDQFKMYDDLDSSVLTIAGHTQVLSDELMSMANTINNEIVTGIQGMIDGTKTLGDVAVSMLRRIGNQILEMAIMGEKGSNGIAGSIFKALGLGVDLLSGFSGGGLKSGLDSKALFNNGLGLPSLAGLPSGFSFANGGRPPVGRASLVGERGPELFVPDRAGTIVPNHAMSGANVTVNVDASGSSVEGSADQASQLGKALGIAVQQELIKQKRPGGLLAR